MDTTLDSRASTTLFCAGVIAFLPAILLYITESIFFLPFIPVAYVGFLFRAKRDFGEFGFASSVLRRWTGALGIGLALSGAFFSSIASSDKLGYYSFLLFCLAYFFLTRGYAPWTRVFAGGTLLATTCESLWGIHRLIHGWLANICFQTASSLADLLHIIHRLSESGLQTTNVVITANKLVYAFDNVWFAAFVAIWLSVYNRRPLFAGVASLFLSVVIYWLTTTIMLVLCISISANTAFLQNNEFTMYCIVFTKLVVQSFWMSRADVGIAMMTLP
ncbi:MAG: hypothetical protein AAF483_25935, partial [Planctomycetota bacterium]